MARFVTASPVPWLRPQRAVIRRSTGIWAWESALHRYGLGPVAGVDEAGRGACAGPLVVAACIPRPGDAARWEGLTDSKLLSPEERERFYYLILRRAVDWAIVIIPPHEVDRRGVHAANVAGMRRAVARLTVSPGYVLTDGFSVPGMARPSLAVPKGDQAAACVAAASVLAKVTRDRIMVKLDKEMPCYGFAEHKGYCTPAHDEALREYGPSAVHRFSFINVRARAVRPVDAVVHNSEMHGSGLAGAGASGGAGVAVSTRRGVES
jgi:ribonuclease HII